VGCEVDLQEQQSEAPHFEVERRTQELSEREVLGLTVLAISVDASDDECALLFCEEVPRFVRLVWEVDHEDEA